MPIRQIISGGQSGADRAALDVALESGIDYGGWVPRGFVAEDGPIDRAKYANLRETDSAEYEVRTEWNVRDSDGTLLISHGPLQGGSALARTHAASYGKPWLHIDLDKVSLPEAIYQVRAWLVAHPIAILNVAGPRQSKDERIYSCVRELLTQLILGATAN